MQVRIKSCSNAALWYNTQQGETYEVSEETPTAYYLLMKPNSSILIDWVLKQDCEVL